MWCQRQSDRKRQTTDLRSRDPRCQQFGDYLVRFGDFQTRSDLQGSQGSQYEQEQGSRSTHLFTRIRDGAEDALGVIEALEGGGKQVRRRGDRCHLVTHLAELLVRDDGRSDDSEEGHEPVLVAQLLGTHARRWLPDARLHPEREDHLEDATRQLLRRLTHQQLANVRPLFLLLATLARLLAPLLPSDHLCDRRDRTSDAR